MKKILTKQQLKLLKNNRWELEDSKWNIGGKTLQAFNFKFVEDIFTYDNKSFFHFLLGIKIDEINVSSVKSKTLLKITINQLCKKSGLSSKTIRNRLNELIDIGLVSVKFKSSSKTPDKPSEYYLHCPATLVLINCVIDEVKEEAEVVETISQDEIMPWQ